MDITNLDDHRKVWKTDAAACAACGHEWQAVYPVGAEDVGLECPACGSGLGSVSLNGDKHDMSPYEDMSSILKWKTIDTIPHGEFVLICDAIDKIIKYGLAEVDELGDTIIICGGIPVTRPSYWTHWAYITLKEKE
jgi:hypothetical protein